MSQVRERYAAAVLAHLVTEPRLATLPLSARRVWLHLVLAMLDRKRTGHGVNPDLNRLAEIVVCRLDDMRSAVALLMDERLLECGADGYLRSPFVMRLMRPAGGR